MGEVHHIRFVRPKNRIKAALDALAQVTVPESLGASWRIRDLMQGQAITRGTGYAKAFSFPLPSRTEDAHMVTSGGKTDRSLMSVELSTPLSVGWETIGNEENLQGSRSPPISRLPGE